MLIFINIYKFSLVVSVCLCYAGYCVCVPILMLSFIKVQVCMTFVPLLYDLLYQMI